MKHSHKTIKRFSCCFLVAIVMMTGAALAQTAYSISASLARGTGTYCPYQVRKDSATGSSAVFNIKNKTANASMYYQIRKPDGTAASNALITSNTGSYSVSYQTDGYGNSLGRSGYYYKVRVAHRSQSSVSGNAYVMFDATP